MEVLVNLMIIIRVSLREIELLNLSYETMNIPKNFTLKNNYIVIKENALENLDIMFNCILDTFLKIGLLENDEPNKIGLELENLNQKINHEYVKLNK
jgi:hypothetical protein